VNTLVIHVGTNDLAASHPQQVLQKLENLVDKFLPQVERMAVSSVIVRQDNQVEAEQISIFNKSMREMCSRKKLCFIDNSNIKEIHLNGSQLHLNKNGDRLLGGNFCRFMRSTKTNQQATGGKSRSNTHNINQQDFLGEFKNHQPIHPSQTQIQTHDNRNWEAYLLTMSKLH
jgi:hypothetical protein